MLILVVHVALAIGVAGSLCKDGLTFRALRRLGTSSCACRSMSVCRVELGCTYSTKLGLGAGRRSTGGMTECVNESNLTYGTDLRIGAGCGSSGGMT